MWAPWIPPELGHWVWGQGQWNRGGGDSNLSPECNVSHPTPFWRRHPAFPSWLASHTFHCKHQKFLAAFCLLPAQAPTQHQECLVFPAVARLNVLNKHIEAHIEVNQLPHYQIWPQGNEPDCIRYQKRAFWLWFRPKFGENIWSHQTWFVRRENCPHLGLQDIFPHLLSWITHLDIYLLNR